MSVINRLEVSNCINLDNYRPNHKDWAPHYPYLEMNFRGLSAAIKATNGTGKTTLNNAYYALVTRDRSMISKFKSRLAPKRKGVWSHFRLEMLYKTPEDNLVPQLFGMELDGEAWVFGMYGYSDDDVRYYFYRGHFEDCPLVTKDGHKRTLIHNDDFTDKLKTLPDANTTLSVSDWKKVIGRHIDESITQKMLAYHKAGGGDGTDNFFKVNQRVGEDYDTAFFYSHIAPETLVDCMGSFGDDDEHGFEDTLLKSAKAILDAKHSVDKTAKDIEKLSRTYRILASAKDYADQHRDAQDYLAKEARETLAEFHFLREYISETPLPLLPVPMEHNNSQTQYIANSMILQDGEWSLPDYAISEIIGLDVKVINQISDKKRLPWKSLKRSQLIEISSDLEISRLVTGGHSGRVYQQQAALVIVRESERFAEGWSRDAALRAINYAWDWRSGDGEYNIFRKLRKETEKEFEALGKIIQENENNREEKTGMLQRLNNEIQAISQAVAALSKMRQSDLFTEDELTNPLSAGKVVELDRKKAKEELAELLRRHFALEDGRKAHARVTEAFEQKSPHEARDMLVADLENAKQMSLQAKLAQENAKKSALLARKDELEAIEELDCLRSQKGEIDILTPYMRRFESLFPDENPSALAKTVPQELEQAKIRRGELTSQIEGAIELASKFSALKSGVMKYQEFFKGEEPQGLAAKVARALNDAEHNAKNLMEQIEQTNDNLLILTNGQANLQNVLERFGRDVNVALLERDLESRENDATALLSQTNEQIKRFSPLVEALEEFEKYYQNALPIEIERQREVRRNIVTVNINSLESDCHRVKKQIADLESVGTAAGRIAREVLDCVGGTPLLVHQAIDNMDLQPERKNALVAHFSHVLHSPVYRDPVDAKLALESLVKAGIEAPIFDLNGLETFCRSGEMSFAEDGPVLGLLAGIETLQVKAILDPSYIPALIQQLQRQIADIEDKLTPLLDEQSELSSDSELNKLISQARKAVEEDARVVLKEAVIHLEQTTTRLTAIRKDRSEDVIKNIRSAVQYLEAGGDKALDTLCKHLAQLKSEIESLNRQMPLLTKRASEESLEVIQSMLDYMQLGGVEGDKCNANTLQLSKDEVAELDIKLPILQSRFEQFSLILKARDFLLLGGWEKAQILEVGIAQAFTTLNKAREEVVSADTHVVKVDELVDATNIQMLDASNATARWDSELLRAIQFMNDGGIYFDATYKEKHSSALSAEDLADRRSHFDFTQAQMAADAENDPFFRENKVKQRDGLNVEIENLGTQIATARNAQEAARLNIDKYRIAAGKIDTAAKVIMDQWKMVRGIIDDLPADQREVVGTHNMFVNDSRRAAADLLDAVYEERWDDALDELDGLAENILQFPLSQRQRAIREHARERQKASKNLKNEVTKILDLPDSNLSEGEIEALANPNNEADLVQSVLNLYRIIEEHLLKAERKQELNQKDVEENKQRMLASMAGFTDNIQDNFDLLKKVMASRGGGASIKISGSVIGIEGMRDKLDNLVEEIDTQLSRRREDLGAGRIAKESEQEFHEGLRAMIRSEFYRAAFRAPEASNASGPTVAFNHPQIGGGRDIPLSKEVSTGQFNALSLLILVKLADYSMRRDARNEYDGLSLSRAKRLSSARTVMIDGLFSNLSDKKMIRDSLSVLRSLKGSFQLIGWIHNQQYENDYELFPACVAIRRTGIKRGYVLAEGVEEPPLKETEEVSAIETHITPMKLEALDDA